MGGNGGDALLRVAGLTKQYRVEDSRVPALRGVDLDVPQGQFLSLLGPSGCGKTTLLRCLAGLEEPDAGEIWIGGQVCRRPDGFSLPPEKRPIGMVFQSYALWPHMTVLDNASYPLRRGRERADRRDAAARVRDMLELVGLQDYVSRYPAELSGGQQQRLALVRALVGKPDLLLLDEPLSNLDARMRTYLRSELRSMQRESGTTTVYVTHDQEEALSMSDMVIVMHDGRFVQRGSPRDIYDRPNTSFVANLVGDANLFPGEGTGRENVVTCGLGLLECTGDGIPDGPLQICVRPEDIALEPTGGGCDGAAGNAVTGKVLDIEFLGKYVRYRVAVPGLELDARVSRSLDLAMGQDVVVRIPAASVWIIPGRRDSQVNGSVPASVG
jgi:iron(III) transport system ATP-binding protein